METKTIKSGVPFVLAGAAVLAMAVLVGLGSLSSYLLAAGAGFLAFAAGKKRFPDHVIEVQRAPASGDPQVDQLIAEARTQLEQIHAANDVIAEEALSAQIEDIEATCRLILARLEEQPHMLSSLRTFLRYYLPVVLKLLDARAGIEEEAHTGGAAQIAGRIRTAMAEVQTAFHKQLDALNAYRFINLESEMDVLADMLRSEGLTQDEEPRTQEAPQEHETQEEDPFSGLFTGGGR